MSIALEALRRLTHPEREPETRTFFFDQTIVTFPLAKMPNGVYRVDGETLEWAKERGTTPISLREVIEQQGADNLFQTVMMDGSQESDRLKNLWRLKRVNLATDKVTLQHCNNVGSYDSDLPPVTISLDDKIFTGIIIQPVEVNGKPVTFVEARKHQLAGGKGWKKKDETILLTNSEGKLVPLPEQP